jgi:tRNA threonylcarbamoyladenosine biosynthesis protein TsaE
MPNLDTFGEWVLDIPDEAATRSLGKAIGARLRAGDVITLTGNLGSGKTVLAQGIAQGVEVPEGYYVTSPSYTMVNVYPGRIPFYHLDLYRISGTADPTDLELDEILYGSGACVVEWPDRIPSGYLSAHLSMVITATGPNTRQIACRGFGTDLWERIQPILEGWRTKKP